MDYYLAPFSGDNYLSGKAVSTPHASPVVCQHHTLEQELHHQITFISTECNESPSVFEFISRVM